MTPAELKFWQLAHRRASTLTPDVASALLRAYAIIRDSLSEAQLARLIESGQVYQIINHVLSDAVLERAFIPFRQRLRDSTQSAFRYTVQSLPRSGRINGVVAVSFDYLAPQVSTAIRVLDSRVMTTLKADVREAVRLRVDEGLTNRLAVRTIARGIRDVVGLAPNMVQEVANYRAKLEAGKSVSSYTLRDKRLTPITPAQIDKAVEAYRKRRIAQHAETVSRTASLDAFKLGQRLAYEDAIAKGIVDRDRLVKTWVGVRDDRERASHLAMEGETVPFDSPWSNGQMIPGDGEWGCRCLARYRVA